MSSLHINGHLTIRELSSGRVLGEGHNAITDIGLAVAVALFSGGQGNPVVDGDTYNTSNISDLYPSIIKLGVASSPTAASHLDTGLSGAVALSLPVVSVTFPSAGVVRCAAVIPADELVGQTLTEGGLFTADGKMIGHLTTAPFPVAKTSLALLVSYDITLTLS